MCIGIPGKIVEIIDAENFIATVELAGVRRTINTGLLTGGDAAGPGDYVLVHIGYAMSKITEAEAIETQQLIDGITEGYFDEADQLQQSAVN